MTLSTTNKFSLIFILFIFFLFSVSSIAQTFPSSTLPSNAESVSDQELYDYWQQAKAQGYTLAQVKSLALARGISPVRIAELEKRINSLGLTSNMSGGQVTDNSLKISKSEPFGFTGEESVVERTKDSLFGYDFFNNRSISFIPNTNLATPANYQLGPGDELTISIWGAAEQTYNTEIDREGAIRIQGIGRILLSGMTIDEATTKIESSLRRIYSGISASPNSPYKVFVGISLSNVRTVQVNIIGEVKVPGTYSLSALSTVLNALYASGGPTKQGTFRDIKLVRNGVELAHFDIYKYLLEGSQEGNLTLRDQDVIIVSPYISRIRVRGSVKRPGIYEIKPNETLANLLAFVSGFKSNAYRERLVLERIEGDRRKVKEVLTANASNEFLKDGDVIEVKTIINEFENKVEIKGAVYRPGTYELTDGLSLFGLIQKAAGVREVAFLDRGLIFSSSNGVTQNVTPFSVSEVINGNTSIELKPNDVVQIFDKYSLSEEYILIIDGAVNSPGVFKYVEDMTVEDLILLGGGFTDGANAGIIDIFRRVNDDEYETLSENFKVSSNGRLNLEGAGSFKLMPNDRVSVRFLRGYSEQIGVSITGEVNYPGSYSIKSKDEKISDLLQQAGGLSPYAFVDGATLIRKNPFYNNKIQSRTYEALESKEESVDDIKDINNRMEFRVGINLKKIIEDPNSRHNLILKNGDILEIPSVSETVKVDGEVLVPSLVRFDKSYSLKDYINKSGGFSTKAKKGKTYVIYANGDIAASKNFLFFRSYPKLVPGALILVPEKPESRNRLSTQEVIGISTGMTTLALLVDRLFK